MGEVVTGVTLLLRAVMFTMSYMCDVEICFEKAGGES
jgi:hypothetical protein